MEDLVEAVVEQVAVVSDHKEGALVGIDQVPKGVQVLEIQEHGGFVHDDDEDKDDTDEKADDSASDAEKSAAEDKESAETEATEDTPTDKEETKAPSDTKKEQDAE